MKTTFEIGEAVTWTIGSGKIQNRGLFIEDLGNGKSSVRCFEVRGLPANLKVEVLNELLEKSDIELR